MKKQLILVTGASSGLGAAIAKSFSAAGYPLVLISRNLKAMEELNLQNVLLKSVDVNDINQLKQAILEAEEKLGPIDCLINNAGVAKSGEFTEISHDDHEKMVNINLQGVINCIEIILPGMQARKQGTVINISSLSDRTSRPNNPVYAATKAAVKSLTESLRMANTKYGIRFCNVAPAKVHSPMWSQEYHQDQFVNADEFAKIILWIYEQRQNVCIRDIVVAPTNYEP